MDIFWNMSKHFDSSIFSYRFRRFLMVDAATVSYFAHTRFYIGHYFYPFILFSA